MALTRISRIKGYRIFRDFVWPESLPALARYNAVYGWNGTGKTTLSSLLRHIQIQHSVTEGSVEFLFGATKVCGSELHNQPVPNVRVFDRDFVGRAVFESNRGQLPPVYYFGEDSAEKQRQIADLAEQRKVLRETQSLKNTAAGQAIVSRETFCTDQARIIKNLLTAPGSPYNNYNAGNFRTEVQRLATLNPRPERLTEEQRNTYVKTKDSRALEKLSSVTVRFPDLGELQLKASKMLGVSVISTVLDELTRDPTVASWVGQGLALHRETDTCHFCAQPLSSDRIADLEAHFNDEFNQFKRQITALQEEIDQALNFESSFSVPPKEALYESWQAEYSAAMAELRQHSQTLKGSLQALKSALIKKQDAPFQKMELGTYLSQIGDGQGLWQVVIGLLALAADAAPFYSSFAGTKALEKLNATIAKHNAFTDSFSSAVKDARNALAQDEVLAAVDTWNAHCSAVTTLEQGRDEAKNSADELDRNIAALEAQVHQHHQPAHELTAELAAYLGRDELKFEAEQNGYKITRAGQPAMHLSDGERTAVAFLYFLKSLQSTDFNLEEGIVVIDDPVSSLDTNSLFSAFGFMKDRTATAKQLIILTHNFTFFRLVRNWFNHLNGKGHKPQKNKPAKAHFYMLSPTLCGGLRSAELGELDSFLSDFESEYHFLFKRVFEASQLEKGQGLEHYYGMPNMARRLLETFLAYRVPNHSGDLHAKLNKLEGDLAVKTRVLRFLHTFSHGDVVAQGDHDPSILAETPAVLRDVLGLIKASDLAHHDAMVDLIHSTSS